MSGGQRYWNEETQRWEDGTQGTAHATPPPPGRPDHEPTMVDPHSDEGALPSPASGPSPASEPPSPSGFPSASGPAPASGLPPVSGLIPASGLPSSYDPATTPPPPPPSGFDPSPAPLPPSPPPAPWSSGPAWPPADQAGPPAAPAGRFDRRRLWAAVVAGAAVVGVTVGLVLTQMGGDGDGDDNGGREQKAAESVTPTDPADTYTSESPTGETPEDTSSPSLTAAQLPTGYESFYDPQGFRTAVPDGWERDSVPSEYGMDVVNFRSPDGEQRIQVFEVAEATPQESFDLFLSPDTPKSDSFRQLGREDLNDGDFVGERLEYLVDSIRGEPDVGTWHVVDTRFAASDGTLYAVAVYGSDDDGRSDEVEMADTAVGWFCPPGGTCAG